MAVSSAAPNRWAIAWAGVLVMILAGTVYAWSNFTQPLIASFGWNATQASLVFGIAIFFIGVGAVFGGRWQDRVGPHDVWWWDVTYGVIGGFGNGMAYITPVATVTKWFPDKRGLASGMVVMGFGLGAFIYGFVLKAVPGFVQASKDAGAYADAKSAAVVAGTPFDAAAHAMPAADVAAIMQVL